MQVEELHDPEAKSVSDCCFPQNSKNIKRKTKMLKIDLEHKVRSKKQYIKLKKQAVKNREKIKTN